MSTMADFMTSFDHIWSSDVAWPPDYAPLREAISHLLLDEKLAGYRCSIDQLLTPLNSLIGSYAGRKDILLINASLIKRAFRKCGDEFSVPYSHMRIKEGGGGVLHCRVEKQVMAARALDGDGTMTTVTDFGFYDSDIAGWLSHEAPEEHPLDNWAQFRKSFKIPNRVRMRLNLFLKAKQAKRIKRKKRKKRKKKKRKEAEKEKAHRGSLDSIPERSGRAKSLPPRRRSKSMRQSKSGRSKSLSRRSREKSTNHLSKSKKRSRKSKKKSKSSTSRRSPNILRMRSRSTPKSGINSSTSSSKSGERSKSMRRSKTNTSRSKSLQPQSLSKFIPSTGSRSSQPQSSSGGRGRAAQGTRIPLTSRRIQMKSHSPRRRGLKANSLQRSRRSKSNPPQRCHTKPNTRLSQVSSIESDNQYKNQAFRLDADGVINDLGEFYDSGESDMSAGNTQTVNMGRIGDIPRERSSQKLLEDFPRSRSEEKLQQGIHIRGISAGTTRILMDQRNDGGGSKDNLPNTCQNNTRNELMDKLRKEAGAAPPNSPKRSSIDSYTIIEKELRTSMVRSSFAASLLAKTMDVDDAGDENDVDITPELLGPRGATQSLEELEAYYAALASAQGMVLPRRSDGFPSNFPLASSNEKMKGNVVMADLLQTPSHKFDANDFRNTEQFSDSLVSDKWKRQLSLESQDQTSISTSSGEDQSGSDSDSSSSWDQSRGSDEYKKRRSSQSESECSSDAIASSSEIVEPENNLTKLTPTLPTVNMSVMSSGPQLNSTGSVGVIQSMPNSTVRTLDKDDARNEAGPIKCISEDDSLFMTTNDTQNAMGSFSNFAPPSPQPVLEENIRRLPVMPADAVTSTSSQPNRKGSGSVTSAKSVNTSGSGHFSAKGDSLGGKPGGMEQLNVNDKSSNFSNANTTSNSPRRLKPGADEGLQSAGELERPGKQPSFTVPAPAIPDTNSAGEILIEACEEVGRNGSDSKQTTSLVSDSRNILPRISQISDPLASEKWGLLWTLNDQEQTSKAASSEDSQSSSQSSTGFTQRSDEDHQVVTQPPNQQQLQQQHAESSSHPQKHQLYMPQKFYDSFPLQQKQMFNTQRSMPTDTQPFSRSTSCPEPPSSSGTETFSRSTPSEKMSESVSTYTFTPFRPMLPRELLLENNLRRYNPAMPLPKLSANASLSAISLLKKSGGRSRSDPEIGDGGRSDTETFSTKSLATVRQTQSREFSLGTSPLRRYYPNMPGRRINNESSGVSGSMNLNREIQQDSSSVNFNTPAMTAGPQQRPRMPRSSINSRGTISAVSSMRRISELPDEEDEENEVAGEIGGNGEHIGDNAVGKRIYIKSLSSVHDEELIDEEENGIDEDKSSAENSSAKSSVNGLQQKSNVDEKLESKIHLHQPSIWMPKRNSRNENGPPLLDGMTKGAPDGEVSPSSLINPPDENPIVASTATAKFGRMLEECRHLVKTHDINNATPFSKESSSEITNVKGRCSSKSSLHISLGEGWGMDGIDSRESPVAIGSNMNVGEVNQNNSSKNSSNKPYSIPTSHSSRSGNRKEVFDMSDISLGVDHMYLEMDKLQDSQEKLYGKLGMNSKTFLKLPYSTKGGGQEEEEVDEQDEHPELSGLNQVVSGGVYSESGSSFSESGSYESDSEESLNLRSSGLNLHSTRGSMVSELSLGGASLFKPTESRDRHSASPTSDGSET